MAEEDPRKHIAESIRRLEGLLEVLPNDTLKGLRSKIATLRATLLESRPPAIALVGRRGSGKSSLVNSIFATKVAEVGHVRAETAYGRWFDYENGKGTLSILDTRGFHEGQAPAALEGVAAPDAMASLMVELERKPPDAVLLVVRAFDVDSAIDADLDALEEIIRTLERRHRRAPPIFAVLTHADVLEPRDADLTGSDTNPDVKEKLGNVALAERTLDQKIKSRPVLTPHVVRTFAVSSYLSFRADGSVRTDDRWRIHELVRGLYEKMPEESRGVLARIAQADEIKESLAKDLTAATAALCAGIAAVPIPVGDVIPITSAQVSLVLGIAWIAGRTLESKAASEFLTAVGVNVGAGFVLREGARALLKYVFPGGGSLLSAAVAFSGTMAVGAAARAYFIRNEPIDAVRKIFRRG